MNKGMLNVLVAVMVLTHSGSAQAGWFDWNKKESENKAKETVNTQIQKAKEVLPQSPAAVMPSSAPVKAQANNAAQVKSRFVDIGQDRVMTEQEISAAQQKEEQTRIRLSKEEMEKMKKEMAQLQQGIKTAREAKQAVQTVTADLKPQAVPVVPKLPVIPAIQKPATTAPLKPESFKKVDTTTATGLNK